MTNKIIVSGSKTICSESWIDWTLFTDMVAALDYIEETCWGTNHQYWMARPRIKTRRNGQVLVTQACGLNY